MRTTRTRNRETSGHKRTFCIWGAVAALALLLGVAAGCDQALLHDVRSTAGDAVSSAWSSLVDQALGNFTSAVQNIK